VQDVRRVVHVELLLIWYFLRSLFLSRLDHICRAIVVRIPAMPLYNKLSDSLTEFDIIIAGGYFSLLAPSSTQTNLPLQAVQQAASSPGASPPFPQPQHPRHRRRRQQQRCVAHRQSRVLPAEPAADDKNGAVLQGQQGAAASWSRADCAVWRHTGRQEFV